MATRAFEYLKETGIADDIMCIKDVIRQVVHKYGFGIRVASSART